MVDKANISITRQINSQTNQIESRNSIEIVNSRPLRIGIDMSNVCNISCIFCLAKSTRKKKTDEGAFRSIEFLKGYDSLWPYVSRAIFSSFETIIAPEFPNAVEYIHQWHTPFNIFTNALALTPELSEFCLSRGLASMNCSVHSPDRDTYQSIMRGSDFDTVISNLMHLKVLAKKINPEFRLTLVFCAMRRNIEQLSDYVDLAFAVGAHAIQVNYLLVVNREFGLEHESVFFHQDLYDRHIRRAKARANAMGINLMHQPTFKDYAPNSAPSPCYRPWEHLIINAQGQMSVCCGGGNVPGNFFEEDFTKVWNSKHLQAFRRLVNSPNPPGVCKKCTRGRENPLDPRNHLTYLKNMDKREQRKLLDEIVRDMEVQRTVSIPQSPALSAPCAL